MLGLYGINKLSVIPGRSEPSHKSEMITQVLFGETYQVLEEYASWFKIKLTTDGYECWINRQHYFPLSEKAYKDLQKAPVFMSAELLQIVQSGKNHYIVPMGAYFPLYQNNSFRIENFVYETYGKTVRSPGHQEYNGQAAVEFAMMFLNAPYLWGGKTVMGIDCSGLVQICCALAGYQLPRDTKEQVKHGTSISFLEEVQTGDLAFFHNEEGAIVHTGLFVNHEYIIHASGRVRIDKIDHYGIFAPELRTHSHYLRVIKRLL